MLAEVLVELPELSKEEELDHLGVFGVAGEVLDVEVAQVGFFQQAQQNPEAAWLPRVEQDAPCD